MYRKPMPHEGIVCPESKTKKVHPPESVYDVVTPDRKTVSRGILGKHRHGWGNPECPWVGLPVDVVPINKKETQFDIPKDLVS